MSTIMNRGRGMAAIACRNVRIFVAGAGGPIGVRLIPLAFLAGVTVLYIQTAPQAS
jgi:hypothetical protein